MKSATSILAFFLFLPMFSYAQPGMRQTAGGRGDDDLSTLSISSENGDLFQLVVNGINQNMTPVSKIRVEALAQNLNDIEIIFADQHTPAIRRQLNIADPLDGKPVNMFLKIERGRDGNARLKFQGCTEVDKYYKSAGDEFVMTYSQRQGGGYQNNIPPQQPAGPTAMDAASFNEAKRSIANTSFDDTKFSTAKSILAGNYFTTDQVIQICNLFSFDDKKLEFAKVAYSKTVDNNNYYKVANAINFDSNKQALNDFISSQH